MNQQEFDSLVPALRVSRRGFIPPLVCFLD